MKYFQKIHKLFLILISFNYNWYRALIFFRVAPSTEHISFLKSLEDLDQIIDVGANRGQFGLAALSVFPNCKYICFEPIKDAYKVLKNVLIFKRDILIKKCIDKSLIKVSAGKEYFESFRKFKF